MEKKDKVTKIYRTALVTDKEVLVDDDDYCSIMSSKDRFVCIHPLYNAGTRYSLSYDYMQVNPDHIVSMTMIKSCQTVYR